LKVTRAVGQGFSITHKGWPIIAVIFVFNAFIRFFSAPNEEIPPYLKSMGDWGIAALIFLMMVAGVNYMLAGVQAFAKGGVQGRRYGFKEFFGNCKKYFFGQLGVSIFLSLPFWILGFLSVALVFGAMATYGKYAVTSVVLGLSAAVMVAIFAVFLIVTSESWAIAAADEKGVFRSIGRSLVFCGGRFFSVTGLLLLIFVLSIAISLIVWISYAFILQGLRQLGLEGRAFILREVTGCALNAYFFLFSASSLMAYYLNNRKEDERHN